MELMIVAMIVLSVGLVFGIPNRRAWVPVRWNTRRYGRF